MWQSKEQSACQEKENPAAEPSWSWDQRLGHKAPQAYLECPVVQGQMEKPVIDLSRKLQEM